MIKLHTCLRCSHQWPSKLEVPKTCSKCRSPYWDIPRTFNKPVADFPVEIEKKSAASPKIGSDKKETIGGLQALVDSIHAKTDKKSIVNTQPSKPVEDQPDPYSEPEYQYGDI